ATGEAVRTIPLGDPLDHGRPTFPFSLGGIEPDPAADGVYVSVGGQLYRVDGESGDVQDLGEFPYRTFAALNDGSLAMSSGPELFHWTPSAPDTTPPTVTVATTYVDGERWPYLEITAAGEGGSGIAEVRYRLDDGDWQPYTEPVRIRPGRHHVEVTVTDGAGNETTRTEHVLAQPQTGRG